MKIALLTIWHEKNYGAELQAYSTIKILQNLGHDVEMINIYLSDSRNYSLKGKISRYISSYGPGHRKFEKFWAQNIPTTRRYKSAKELIADPPLADYYIVGSDQVWNPDITKSFSKLFFLDFGSPKIKRASISSSFGTDKWKYADLISDISALLNNFQKITCREESGLKIIKDVFQNNATCILDPTLILGEFNSFLAETETKNTLVYYPLSNDPELENCGESIAIELGLTPINNNKQTFILPKIIWDKTSIEEWIQNIATAKFVLTRSFHGLCFALLFKREFAIVANKNGRNTRVVNLLSKLDLLNRYFETFEEFEKANIWENNIDYSAVSKKLASFREESYSEIKSIFK